MRFVPHLPEFAKETLTEMHKNHSKIVWRFLKYHWLPLSAYRSYKKLKESLIDVLDGIGTEYTISFA